MAEIVERNGCEANASGLQQTLSENLTFRQCTAIVTEDYDVINGVQLDSRFLPDMGFHGDCKMCDSKSKKFESHKQERLPATSIWPVTGRSFSRSDQIRPN